MALIVVLINKDVTNNRDFIHYLQNNLIGEARSQALCFEFRILESLCEEQYHEEMVFDGY